MKRALVTGASGTIGRAICRRLSADGHFIYIHANSSLEAAERLAGEIDGLGGAAKVVSFDVTDAQATRTALESLIADGSIQILINNAGIHDDAAMPGMRPDQWARVLAVTLDGFFNVTQPLLLPMIGTRWGRIINMSSIAGVIGNRGQVNYAAAKSGLHGATKALALEVASRGITVNSVAPGIIRSPVADRVFDNLAIERMVPMKRAGTPEEVADLVGFLASERASYISGQIISINGAMA